MKTEDIVKTLVEVELPDETCFLKVKETLTRMGVMSRKTNSLFQSCHILQKRGKYYIVHFKELFALDGRYTEITKEDLARRNMIVHYLESWNLVKVVSVENSKVPEPSNKFLSVLSFREKDKWNLVEKYRIGPKKSPV